MDRIVLDRVVDLNQDVIIEGPLIEALRFRGARAGDLVTATDACGTDFRARVVQLSTTAARLHVFECLSPTESSVEIVLLQALPEKERMEWIIQKTSELGVSAIVPFKSERSISIEEREAKQKKAHRWQEIVVRAVRQSRRARVPRVESYRSFDDALLRCGGGSLKIILSEKRGQSMKSLLVRPHPASICLMVGPEGGFAPEEVARAESAGFIPVKLGERILRTETAAITAVGILQYEVGDLG
jgi:16S rRNA (uracil1498-N3)-methyltransferase